LRIAKRSDGAAKRHSEEGILRVLREAESGHTVGVDAAEIGFYRRDPLEEKHHRNGRTTIEHPESLQEIACVKQFEWYKGILTSQMAGTADNGGAFDLVIAKMRRGTEPQPHVHSREDEFFYILSGEMKVYADGEVFQVTAGECMFLPRGKSHAWLITSDESGTIFKIGRTVRRPIPELSLMRRERLSRKLWRPPL